MIFSLLSLSLSLLLADQPGAGRCGTPTERFLSAEGGCLDLRTACSWSRRKDNRVSAGEASNYCRVLGQSREGGASDWRLPTEGELRSLMASPRSAARLDNPFAFPIDDFFWSSSGNFEGAWTVLLEDVDEMAFRAPSAEAAVVCVREATDSDKDGVADSVDLCPGSAPQSAVDLLAKRRGCGTGQLSFQDPIVVRKGYFSPLQEYISSTHFIFPIESRPVSGGVYELVMPEGHFHEPSSAPQSFLCRVEEDNAGIRRTICRPRDFSFKSYVIHVTSPSTLDCYYELGVSIYRGLRIFDAPARPH